MKTEYSTKSITSGTTSSVLALLIAAAASTATTKSVSAMSASPEPFRHIQPNGVVVQLKYKGGPVDHWVTDMDDYTVVLADDGTYVYAEQGNDDAGNPGDLQPTGRMVTPEGHQDDETIVQLEALSTSSSSATRSSPSPIKRGMPLQKNLRPAFRKNCGPGTFCYDHGQDNKISLGEMMTGQSERNSTATVSSDDHDRKRMLRGTVGDDDHDIVRRPKNVQELKSSLSVVRRNLESKTGPTGGKLRNLVIMMRWSDHDERNLPTRDEIDILMNHEGQHALAPTGSVRDAFLENSYGKLDLESVVLDWVPMTLSESFIANGDSGLTTRFHLAIREALQYIDSNNLVDFDYFDADQDGEIDAITFLHSGYAAERGGLDEFGTNEGNRIWSHKWGLVMPFVSNDGVRVQKYHVSTALWGLRGNEIGRIGVIVHEMGHFLGLPDLYDPDQFGGAGVGSWGVMGNSWGFDWSQHYPCHGSAYMKAELGWLDVQSPTPGTNLVSRTTDHNPTNPQIYKITEGFPDGEYLLIENRQPYGLDSLIPQGGLIIYHIDEAAALHTEGFPGQPGWPLNGNHYAVSVVQADGMYHLEGGMNGLNAGDAGDPFHGAGVNSLTPCFEGVSCRYPNTDSYQNGIVNRTNVHITEISNSGDVMSFNYQVSDTQLPPPSIPPPSSSAATATTGTASLMLVGGMSIVRNVPVVLGIATTLAAMVVGATI